jgi:hypothetical protein
MSKNLIDRPWIVFYWVSQNIEYDLDSFFSGNISYQTSDDVFRNKKRVFVMHMVLFLKQFVMVYS